MSTLSPAWGGPDAKPGVGEPASSKKAAERCTAPELDGGPDAK